MINFLLFFTVFYINAQNKLPSNFVYLYEINNTIIEDIKYASINNFVGTIIDGYNKNTKCILTKETALALNEIQNELKKENLSLRVYDCYRPQEAVNHFIRWSKNENDQKNKKEFYPNIEKKELFKKGYLAKKSKHTQGNTIDLTIDTLDFGTIYDFLDPKSNTENLRISNEQKINRKKLKTLMKKHGFKNVKIEWWHYTLSNKKGLLNHERK